MKEIAKFENSLGSDGKLGGSLSLKDDQLQLEVHVGYPIAKIVEPATKAVDGLLEKLKAAIPGEWDNVLIDKVKEEYKQELVKFLQE